MEKSTLNIPFKGLRILCSCLLVALFAIGNLCAQTNQYVLVTENQNDWSGTYLLTATPTSGEQVGNTVALNGISTTSTTYGLFADLTEFASEAAMVSNATTDACAVVVTATGNGTYTMNLTGVGFLGWTSGNSLRANAVAANNNYEWQFSISDGELQIQNANTTARLLQFNPGSPRFACYTTSQTPCKLYKSNAIPAVAMPAFSAGTGTYYATQTVSVTGPEGAAIHYTLDGTTPTVESPLYETPISIEENTTLKAIALLDDETSAVNTAVYTIIIPVELDNIAAFKAQTSTTDVFRIDNTMTVLFQTSDKYHTFVQDETGALYIYGTCSHNYNPGDQIVGGIYGKYKNYNGLNELTPIAALPSAAGVAGAAVAPIQVTLAQLQANYAAYEGKLVTVKGIRFNEDWTFRTNSAQGPFVSQPGATADFKVYNTFKTLTASVEENQRADVTGLVIIYNDVIEIVPRNNEDLVLYALPATLPYACDFETADQRAEWTLSNNGNNQWFIGQASDFGNNKLYVTCSEGSTNKYDVTSASTLVAQREVVIPANGAILTFDARVNGEMGHDYLTVTLVNEEGTTVLSDLVDVNDWHNYRVGIGPELAGLAMLSINWTNDANGNGSQFPAAIDNIALVESSCVNPSNLTAVVNGANATITWSAAEGQDAWTFQYRLAGRDAWYTMNTTQPTVTLADLQGNSAYEMRVKADCGAQSSEWIFGAFEIACQNGSVDATEITVGTGTSTQDHLFGGYYGFAYSANLYNPSEYGQINDISFYLNAASAASGSYRMTMWVKVVPADFALSTSQTFSALREGAVQIYDGVPDYNNAGWIQFPITNGITLSEGQALLVLTHTLGCTTSGGCTKYARYTSTSNKVWYKRADGSDPGENISGSLTSYLPNIKINMMVNNCEDAVACATPTNLTVVDVDYNSAEVAWTAASDEQTDFIVEYAVSGSPVWTVIDVTGATQYTLTGLLPLTDYNVRVKANCGAYNTSDVTSVATFTTTSSCASVSNITVAAYLNNTMLTWTPGGNESSWTVEFKQHDATEWTAAQVVDAAFTLGNLPEQKMFDVRVRANCSEENVSDWTYAQFVSGCAAMDVPYAQNMSLNTLPDCWSQDGNFEYSTSYGTYTNTENAWLITPSFNIPTTGTYYLKYKAIGDFSISASTNGTVLSYFAEVASENMEQITTKFIAIPAAYNGTLATFMFRNLTNGYFQLFDFEVTPCPYVATNLSSSNRTETSATVTWESQVPSTWVVEYALAGSDQWTSTTTTENHVDLTGLQGGSDYEVRVKAECREDYSMIYVTTECGAFNVPFAENFDNLSAGDYINPNLPNCWMTLGNVVGSSSTYPQVYVNNTNSAYVTSSPNGIFFKSKSNTPEYVILPRISTQDVVLSFSYRNEGTTASNGTLSVGYFTDPTDASTFHSLHTYPRNNVLSEQELVIEGIQGDYYIAFEYMGGSSNNYYLGIDDVEVNAIPNCFAPMAVTTSVVDAETIRLSWSPASSSDGGETWNIEYGPQGFTPGTGTMLNSTATSVNIPGLTYAETYDFYVRANCGAGATSAWTGPATAAVLLTWNLGSTHEITACGGILYDDGGANGSYSNNTTQQNSYMIIHPTDVNGQVILSGTYKTENNYDKIYIYDGEGLSATLVSTLTGTGTLAPMTSTNGAFTVAMSADGSINYDGFQFLIECELPETPDVPIVCTDHIVGTGTASTYEAPFNNYYKNSWTESIYSAEDLDMDGVGTINDISWYVNSTSSLECTGIRIYMGTTSKDAYSSTSDWQPMSDLTLVYNHAGTIGTAAGWETFVLDEPFEYNSAENLVVVVARTSSSYSSSLKYAYTSKSNSVLYRRGDYDVSYAEHPGTNAGSRVAYCPNIKVNICQAVAACEKPASVTVENITASEADVTWPAGTASAWNVKYGPTGFDVETEGTLMTATANTAHLTGLHYATVYDVYVQAVCGGNEVSSWKSATFNTDCAVVTDFPFAEGFENGVPPLCWTAVKVSGSGTTNWQTSTGTVHSGEGAAYIADQSATTVHNLITPAFNIPSANAFELSFWAYRADNYATKYEEGVQVLVNTTPTLTGATELIYVHRNYTLAPVETSSGWHEYKVNIPVEGEYYIIFKGVNEYGGASYIDDITIRQVRFDKDLAITAVGAPADACDFDGKAVSVTVRNDNTDGSDITAFTASYVLNGGAPVSETVSANIAAGEEYTYVFNTIPAYTDENTFTFTINYDGDSFAENDVMTSSTSHLLTPIDVPYTQNFAAVTLNTNGWNVVDANNDDVTWTKSGSNLRYTYNDALAANDWMITPCFYLPAGKYEVSFDYNTLSSIPENIAVYYGMGNDVADMNTMIGNYQNIAGNGVAETVFTVAAGGVYNFGILASSVAGGMGIDINNLNITPVYDIEIVNGEHGTSTPNGLVMAHHGENLFVQVNPENHYHIASIFVDGEQVMGADMTCSDIYFYTLNDIQANHVVNITYTINPAITYTVMTGQAICDGHTIVAPNSWTHYVNYVNGVITDIQPVPGFNLDSVMFDGFATGEINHWNFGQVAENHFVEVYTSVADYIVTTHAYGNGEVSDGIAFTFDPENPVDYTFTATAADGNYIGYLMINNEVINVTPGSVEFTYTMENVTDNYDFVVYFMSDIYNVTATAVGNGTVNPVGTQNFYYGENTTITATADAGYYIASVNVDGEETTFTQSDNMYEWTVSFNNIDNNHNVTVNFAAEHYIITVEAGANGTISAPASYYVYGATPTFTITPSAGYAIADVTVDGVSVGTSNTYTFTALDANHTLAATFTALQYTITATAGNGGSITPAGATTLMYNGTQAYAVAAAAGYHIENVYVDGVAQGALNSYTFTAVQSNHTIYATFAPNEYTITVSQPAHGHITPGTTSVLYGATASFTITPATGYTVTAITVDGTNVIAAATEVNGTYTYLFNNVNANHTITATMTQKTFTISATAGANGTITPAGNTTVNYGAARSYTITPSNGYVIDNVVVDGINRGAVASYTFVNVVANHTISATFKMAECEMPENMQTLNIETTSAMLTWYHAGAQSFDIQYKALDAPTFTVINNVPGFTYDLTNLNPGTSYVWMVRANCMTNNSSEWTNGCTFRTLEDVSTIGVEEYENLVKVYAHSNNVYIINNNNVLIDNVTIYDVYGKLVYSGQVNSTSEVISMNVATGTYMVRLSTDKGMMNYKLHLTR